MKERLLITTAIGLMLGTAAFAQSPSEQPKNNPPPAAQNQTNSNSSAPAASSSTSSPSSAPSTQSQSTPSGTGSTTTSQSGNNAAPAPSQAQSAQPSNSPAQAQSNTAPPANTNQTQSSPTGTNNAGTQPSTNTAAQPSNNQTNTAAQPSNNQTNTAAQPSTNQTNTAQSSSSNVRVSASLNETQRTRVSESIARLNVAPLNNVNFSLSVGTVVPRDVRFQPLPADIVEVMPQYRGYNFFVVRDEIVIIEPTTYKIVDVLPRTGRSTAAAPAPHRTTFSDRDREVIRKHARSSRTEQRTTGSATSTRVKVGERLPDSVEIRSFPDEVYRESPSLREYRYIERDNRTYLMNRANARLSKRSTNGKKERRLSGRLSACQNSGP
jgi:chemotaxis protein histidine kinase CheA